MIRKTRLIGVMLVIVLTGMAMPAGIPGAWASDTDQTIPLEVFRDAFDQFVLAQPDLSSSDVVISKFRVVRNNPIPAGDVDIQLLRTNNRPFSRHVRVKAVISVDGIPVNNAEVFAWLDVFESVVCAAGNIPQGHVIKKKDLYVERRNISRNMEDVMRDAGQLVGLMAKHTVRSGDMVRDWMVERKPVVRRGDQVTILVETGLLRVTSPGTALEDGFAGETVSVENRMSNKKIFARVVDEVTVRVDI